LGHEHLLNVSGELFQRFFLRACAFENLVPLPYHPHRTLQFDSLRSNDLKPANVVTNLPVQRTILLKPNVGSEISSASAREIPDRCTRWQLPFRLPQVPMDF